MSETYPNEQKALAWFDSLSDLQRKAIMTAYNLEAMTTAEELAELYSCEDQALSVKIKHKKTRSFWNGL